MSGRASYVKTRPYQYRKLTGAMKRMMAATYFENVLVMFNHLDPFSIFITH